MENESAIEKEVETWETEGQRIQTVARGSRISTLKIPRCSRLNKNAAFLYITCIYAPTESPAMLTIERYANGPDAISGHWRWVRKAMTVDLWQTFASKYDKA